MISRRVVVRGRVQGVFFREETRRRAEKRGVSGWVRNRDDGAVEAVFEGDPGPVEALVRFCEQGPRGAAVAGIEAREEPVVGLVGFEVR